jgi:hypothetical protein
MGLEPKIHNPATLEYSGTKTGDPFILEGKLMKDMKVVPGVKIAGVDIAKLDVNVSRYLISAPPLINFFGGIFPRTSTVTDTGSEAVLTSIVQRVATGATSGSTSGIVFTDSQFANKDEPGNRFQLFFRILTLTPTDKCEIWWGLFSDTTTFPAAISNHIALHAVSDTDGVEAVLSASNGDGSTEKSTDIGSIYQWYYKDVLIVYGAANIKFYMRDPGSEAWTFVANHNVNRPDDVVLFPGVWIKNTEAEDKQAEIQGIKIVWSDGE